MIATARREWWVYLGVPLGALLAVGLGVGLLASPLRPVIYLLLVAQGAMFLLFFKRPVWILASLVVGQLTMANYMSGLGGIQFSNKLIWAIAALLIAVPLLARSKVDLGPGARRLIPPLLAFIALTVLANATYTDPGYVFKYFRQTAFWLVIVLLFPVLAREERDFKLLAVVALTTGTLSAAVAVMQHFSWGPGWDLLVNPSIQQVFGSRVSGLAEAPPQLTWGLTVILLPVIGVYFAQGVRGGWRWLLPFLALIMGIGLYWTWTRSAPVALGLGGLAMGLFFAGRLRREFLLALLLLGGGFWWYTDMRGNRYDQGFTDNQQGASRLVMWQAGVEIVKDHPFLGIGHRDFQEASTEYRSEIDPYYLELYGAGSLLGRNQVHNDFLNIWLSFGTPAFLLFLFFFGTIFYNFIEAFRRLGSPFLKGLSLGCAGAVAGYADNAFFHNVMDSSALLFILAGLSLALSRLARKRGVEDGR